MDPIEMVDFGAQQTADPIEEEKFLLKCQRDKYYIQLDGLTLVKLILFIILAK